MNFHTVFFKTELGHQAIEHRSHGLDARHRTLLILIDGQRSLGVLGDLLGHGGNLAPMLTQLIAQGLVTSDRLVEPAPDQWAASSQRATRRLAGLLRPAAPAGSPGLAGTGPAQNMHPGLLARCRSLVSDGARAKAPDALEGGP